MFIYRNAGGVRGTWSEKGW